MTDFSHISMGNNHFDNDLMYDNVSPFSNDEIFFEMKDMGYEVNRNDIELLKEIERDLVQIENVADNEVMFRVVNDRLNKLLTSSDVNDDKIGKMAIRSQQSANSHSKSLADEIEELILNGYSVFNDVIREINEYQKKIDLLESKSGDQNSWFGLKDIEDLFSQNLPCLSQSNSTPQQNQNYQTDQKDSNQAPHIHHSNEVSQSSIVPRICRPSSEENKENREATKLNQRGKTTDTLKSKGMLIDAPKDWKAITQDESRVLNEFFRENALRPVKCAEPGRLPFRYDPLGKFEQYKNEWEKFSVPGEDRRMSLRWRIRASMCERDIPQVRVLDVDSFSEPCRPHWKT